MVNGFRMGSSRQDLDHILLDVEAVLRRDGVQPRHSAGLVQEVFAADHTSPSPVVCRKTGRAETGSKRDEARSEKVCSSAYRGSRQNLDHFLLHVALFFRAGFGAQPQWGYRGEAPMKLRAKLLGGRGVWQSTYP